MAEKAGEYLRSAIQTHLIVVVLFVLAAVFFGNGDLPTEFGSSSIEENGTINYVGEFSGSAGPTGVPLDEEIEMSVDFDSGELTGTVEGDRVDNGTFDGTVNTQTGGTSGTGTMNAFGVSGVSLEFEGEFMGNSSRAEETWESTGDISGEGTWYVERVDG